MKKRFFIIAVFVVLILFSAASILEFLKTDMHTAKTVHSTANNKNESLSYVALGDSISLGMSATNNSGYTTLFSNYLKASNRQSKLIFINESISGYTTSDLLNQLNNTKVKEEISKADIITISIGGNNLLSPLISTVAGVFLVNPNSPAFINDLALKIGSNPDSAAAILEKLQNPSDPLTIKLNQELQNGVKNFMKEFPAAMTNIRNLSPNSKIYVNNLYNPFLVSDPLYSQYNSVINMINSQIYKQSSSYKYSVVDVGGTFANYKGSEAPVNFSFFNAVAVAKQYSQKSTDVSLQNVLKNVMTYLDPHPNDLGHHLIYKELVVK